MGMREDAKIYGRRCITPILELQDKALAEKRKKTPVAGQQKDDEIDLLKIAQEHQNKPTTTQE